MGVSQLGTEIVSVGYERRDVGDLVEMLSRAGVDVVVDVRLNPVSRKRGFSKAALAQALAGAGIGYRHERDLGNPRWNRDPFRRGEQAARQQYLDYLQNGASPVYREVIDLAHNTRIALLCYEREHDQCHRSCILEVAQRENADLSVLTL